MRSLLNALGQSLRPKGQLVALISADVQGSESAYVRRTLVRKD